jgi:hypothetical protein
LKSYASGSNVSLTIDIKDEDGTLINAKAVSYTLFDANDVEIEPETSAYEFVEGDASVVIVISGDFNTLAANTLTDARRVLIRVTAVDDGVVELNRYYAITSSSKLVLLTNSYQTMQSAELVAMGVGDIDSFASASEAEKVAALATAYERLGSLNYRIDASQSTVNYGQSTISSINAMTSGEFLALPKAFLSKLYLAQVIEADSILSGESVRDTSLLSERVGESSKTWNAKKSLRLQVSKRALEALGSYVNFSVKIGRA